MEKALHFYHQVLGLELLRTSGPHAEGGRSAVLQAGDQKIDLCSRPDLGFEEHLAEHVRLGSNE